MHSIIMTIVAFLVLVLVACSPRPSQLPTADAAATTVPGLDDTAKSASKRRPAAKQKTRPSRKKPRESQAQNSVPNGVEYGGATYPCWLVRWGARTLSEREIRAYDRKATSAQRAA